MVQALRDGVKLHVPKRIVAGFLQRVEVHIYLEFRKRRRHELSVAAEDIAADRLHLHAVLLLPRCDLHPVVPSGGHDI